jgi:hypothetical protein
VRNDYVRILTMGARFDHDNTSRAQHQSKLAAAARDTQDSESKLSLRKIPKSGKSSRKIRGNKTRKFLLRNYFLRRWRQNYYRFARRGAEAQSRAWRQLRAAWPGGSPTKDQRIFAPHLFQREALEDLSLALDARPRLWGWGRPTG